MHEATPHSIPTITTQITAWENKCREWAEANMHFQLRDIRTEHFAFCQQLCDQFDYKYHYKADPLDSIAIFYPPGSYFQPTKPDEKRKSGDN